MYSLKLPLRSNISFTMSVMDQDASSLNDDYRSRS